MTLLKRISTVFHIDSAPPKAKRPPKPPPEIKTHRQRVKERKEQNPDDITTQFATAFEELDKTASQGIAAVEEITKDLTDESSKLKSALAEKKH